MRIVQLVTQDYGGPVDHAGDVAVGLLEQGHDVHLVGPPSPAARRAAARGVSVHEAHLRHKTDVAGGLDVVRRLRALRPDVLHLQDRRAGLVGRGLAPLWPRAAVVYTLHGVADGLSDLVAGNLRVAERRRRDTAYYLHGDRLLARWGGGRVVVPSRAVATYAVDHAGLPEDIVDVVPNGVDPDRFRPTAKSEAGLTAVWIGGLVPGKRLDLLLAAVEQVPTLEVRVVGDGPGREAALADIAARGLAERVTLVGEVEDLGPELEQAHCFVLTSSAENCPMSLLQAMAGGLACVATRVGGVPEVVRDGVDGLLVPPGDAEALAGALRHVAADPDERRRLAGAARARVLADFTLERCVQELIASYGRAAR